MGEPPRVAPAVTVVLSHANPLLRAALTEILRAAPGIGLVGVAADTQQTLALVRSASPATLLLGVDGAGADTATGVRSFAPSIATVVLATVDTRRALDDILRIDATGYVINSIRSDEIIFALHAAAAGGDQATIMAPRTMVRRLVRPGRQSLSAREQTVLLLAARGLTNRQIASELFVTEGTVKRHLHHIYEKLTVQSRTQAVGNALATGIISIEDVGPPEHPTPPVPLRAGNGRAGTHHHQRT